MRIVEVLCQLLYPVSAAGAAYALRHVPRARRPYSP
ncbi:hypothetical protein FB465_2121 [Kitasatospora atroaurantiaca]|uniref:Uncharacterized protein n=1 Tax=Kitasatospora atroaurantiaca TaxID=285545 RepID=A0A561ENB8_9ACTN|nr:hypothetical protein FB465_2121 [Kitasatospora atroaurantiaca]